MRRVAAIAILNDHHLLMGRRRDTGKWTNPGGHLNEGEDPVAGAVREVQEETGLTLDPHLFRKLESRIVKKPGGEKIEVHGFRVDLRTKPSTTIVADPDEEVQRWKWVKTDTDLEHIVDNLHVPLTDNVLLPHILKDKPMKKHVRRFWEGAKKVGKEGFLDVKEKALQEGPQQYLDYRKRQEKKAEDLVHGGKADNKPDSDFPSEQIDKGMKVEREHTDNPQIAKEVAKDHLTEDKKYYDHLKEMEDKYVEKKAFWEEFEKRALNLSQEAEHLQTVAQLVTAGSAATATGIYGLSKLLGVPRAHRESKYYKKQNQLADAQLKMLEGK